MKSFVHRVGETTITKEGYLVTITKYTMSNDIEVTFNDEQNTTIKTSYKQFKKQNICNHKRWYGVFFKRFKPCWL